jgi:hypothetical protein
VGLAAKDLLTNQAIQSAKHPLDKSFAESLLPLLACAEAEGTALDARMTRISA